MSVGITRLDGNAGAVIDIKAFLAGDLSEIKVPVLVNNLGWSYGTGVNAVNLVYADIITLTDGGNDTLNVFDGSLLDIFGRAMTMSAIKLLYVKNKSTDSGMTIGGGVLNDLDIWADTTDKSVITSGGIFLWSDPSAAGILTSVNCKLYLLNDGTGVAGDKLVDVIAMGLD